LQACDKTINGLFLNLDPMHYMLIFLIIIIAAFIIILLLPALLELRKPKDAGPHKIDEETAENES
jgi:hypothetical protein